MRHVTLENRVINFVPPKPQPMGSLHRASEGSNAYLSRAPYLKKAWQSADASAIDRDPLDE
jgi:hypothetical protein